MTYTPLKPDAGPSPALDAPIIQTNFSQFSAKFSSTALGLNYNHTAMNNAGQGNHEVVLTEKQTSDPTVEGNEVILFVKDATSNAGTQPQLFLRIPKFLPTQYDWKTAPNISMQLTYNEVNTAGPVYQSFMAGGYLVFFGTTTNIAIPITLSPAPTSLLLAIAAFQQTNISNTPADIQTTIQSNSQFLITSTNPPTGYTASYIAIGTV